MYQLQFSLPPFICNTRQFGSKRCFYCLLQKKNDHPNVNNVDDLNKLDANSKSPYKLLYVKKTFFSKLELKLVGNIDSLKDKLSDFEDRLGYIEDVISELQDRKIRENNVVICDKQDSSNSSPHDINSIESLLEACDDRPTFEISNGIIRPIEINLLMGKIVLLKLLFMQGTCSLDLRSKERKKMEKMISFSNI